MTAIVWDQVGERRFETGVDRGVLYPGPDEDYTPGVPWNGLTAVTEKVEGEAPKPFYFDGIKYLQLPEYRDFEATLAALTYPEEFEVCEGSYETTDGVLVTLQMPKMFGLCYRTLVGNDVENEKLGYKLHLVYGAMAHPTNKVYSSMTNAAEPVPFAWEISTTPTEISGFRPTAHLVVDSTRFSEATLSELEDILYGTEETDPRLPLPDEVIGLTMGLFFIIPLAEPDPELLPEGEDTPEGSGVFSESDEGAYAVDSDDISEEVRRVITIHDGEPVPSYAEPGDVIYNVDTGVVYRLEA